MSTSSPQHENETPSTGKTSSTSSGLGRRLDPTMQVIVWKILDQMFRDGGISQEESHQLTLAIWGTDGITLEWRCGGNPLYVIGGRSVVWMRQTEFDRIFREREWEAIKFVDRILTILRSTTITWEEIKELYRQGLLTSIQVRDLVERHLGKPGNTPMSSPSTAGTTSPSTPTSPEPSSSSTNSDSSEQETGFANSFVYLREIGGFF